MFLDAENSTFKRISLLYLAQLYSCVSGYLKPWCTIAYNVMLYSEHHSNKLREISTLSVVSMDGWHFYEV